MNKFFAKAWRGVKRGCARVVTALRPVATASFWRRVANAVYRYHYWLGVAVLRRARRVYRFVGRITRKPRRRLRYAWVVAIRRPVHRFFHRMWRLLSGLPRSYIGLWKSMKKNAGNILLWLPRGLWGWVRDYKEEWFTLGRFLGPIAGAVVLMSTIQTWTQTRFCLVLTYDDTEIGMIANASVYDEAASMARSRVTNVDDSFRVAAVPKLTMVVQGAKSTMTATQVCDAILSHSYDSNDIMEATGLYMEGEFMGAVADGDALQQMLDDIKNNSLSTEDEPNEDTDRVIVDQRIEFVQDIYTETGLFPISTLKSVDELHGRLASKEITERKYTVQAGDTYSGIAKKHNMTVAELQKLNHLENIDSLQIGQVLLVQRPQYFLQVVVVETMREEGVTVPYKTRTVYRDDKYTDWSNVKVKGTNGTKTVLTEIVMLDGYELERMVVEEITTKEPVTRVVEVGTKKRPSSSGNIVQGDGVTTGNMTWPVPICRRVYQGYHSGHKAIDISSGPVPVLGKPCLAADGGVVIQASTGWNGGYGTVVKIRHSNGLITVYAHLQSLNVKQGQQVTRGQQIGKVGNTGRSTGPHLHFEVIKDGVKVNPLNYVSPSR